MKEYKPHPASEYYAFPLLSGKERDDLEASIQKDGQLDPIILLDDMILEGRNRYAACIKLGIEVKTTLYVDKMDPYEFVYVKNVNRRHMTRAQKAAAAAKRANAPHGGVDYAKKRSFQTKDRFSKTPVTVPKAASEAGLSVTAVEKAKAAMHKAPAAFKALEEDKINVEQAYQISRLPEVEQPSVLAEKIASNVGGVTKGRTPSEYKSEPSKPSPLDSPTFKKKEAERMAFVNAPSLYPEDAEWPVHPGGKIQTDYIQEAIRELRENESDIWSMSWDDIFHENGKIWLFTQRIQTYALQSSSHGGTVGTTRGPIDPRLVKWAENVAKKARHREAHIFEVSNIRKAVREKRKSEPPKAKRPKRNINQVSVFGQKLKNLLLDQRFTAADKDAVLAEAHSVLNNYFEERWAEYAKSSGALKTNGSMPDHNGQADPLLRKEIA